MRKAAGTSPGMDWKRAVEELKAFRGAYKDLMALRVPSASASKDTLLEFFYEAYMGNARKEMIEGMSGMATYAEAEKYLLPSDNSTEFGQRVIFLYPDIKSREDLWDAGSDLMSEANNVAYYFPTKWERDKDFLVQFVEAFEMFQKELKRYAKILQKYIKIVAPGDSSFSWKGFRVTNPDGVPDIILHQVLDGINEGLSIFKERGIEELLYDELNTIIISATDEKTRVGESDVSVAGWYRSREKAIELKASAVNHHAPRLYERWITEVFIHEFGHHVHMTYLQGEAKEFWDGGWAKVEEVSEKIEKDLEITDADRQEWLKEVEKANYDLQIAGRNLDSISRLKYLWVLYKNDFFTVPTQARLTDKAESVMKALQEGIQAVDWQKGWHSVELQEYLYEAPKLTTTDQTLPQVIWQIDELGKALGAQDYELPRRQKRIEPNRLLEDYRESREPDIQEALDALGIPSEYGKTNVKEDFAETFVQFVTAPWKLSETARWRMGRTLGMSDSLGKPVMKLTKRIASRFFESRYRLSQRDKKVIEAFVKKRKAEGKLLTTDGRILHKHGLGGERVARWRADHIAVLSSESVKSDDTILRYLKKVSPKPVRYEVERDGLKPTLTLKSGGDAGPNRQWDGWINAYVPEEKDPVGRLLWTEWWGEYRINHVVVDPDYQRMGIASAMYRKLFEENGITERDLGPSMQTPDGAAFRRRLHSNMAGRVAQRFLQSTDDDPFEEQCRTGGTCYQDAANYLLRRAGPNAVLVHGRPTLQVAPYIEYGHAWVEEGNTVIDAATGTELPKAVYYAIGQIDRRNNLIYTKEETTAFLLSHGHYGPWEGPEGVGPDPSSKKQWLDRGEEMPSRSKHSHVKEAKTYNRIVMFDFDGTLFRSWEEKPSWWQDQTPWSFVSHPSSLGEPCVPHKPGSPYWISEAVSEAQREGSDRNSLSVLITGRIAEFKDRVHELLKQQGIKVDKSYFNPGMNAAKFKSAVLKNLLVMYHTVDEVIVWENDNVRTYDSVLKQTVEGLDRDVKVTVNHIKERPQAIMCGPQDFDFESGKAKRVATRIASKLTNTEDNS